MCLKCESGSSHFQPGEGPSSSHHRLNVFTYSTWCLPRPPALAVHHDDSPRPAHPLVHVAQRLAGRLARAQAAAEAGRDGVGQHHLGDALPVPRGGHLPGDRQQRLALHYSAV